MAETYEVTFRHSAPWVGCEGSETYSLGEFGYTDEVWDGLSVGEQKNLLHGWAQEELWNVGYEFRGEVDRG